MRRQGPLTLRHLVAAALVVLVVNAQLTWWIIFVLRENRHRLQLEREGLRQRAELAAARVEAAGQDARNALEAALLAGMRPGTDPPPSPFFASWAPAAPEVCSHRWWRRPDGPVAGVRTGEGCVAATAAEDWLEQLRAVAPDLEMVPDAAAVGDSPWVVPVAAPLAQAGIRPRAEVWAGLLEDYRGRIVMIVSEGTFFALLLFVMLALLWKTLRREVELERQHRNFLSAITHELKSPLAAMRLSLETVLRGRADTTASVRFLENALQDAERLQSLVQKVLEVTRYGRGQGTLQLRRGPVTDVVEDAVATFSRRATAAGARLDVELQPGVWAEVDEEALGIVVSNLLENGIKYGGTVPQLTVRLAVRDGRALLDVGDNGRGIAADDLPFVFNRFYRGGDEMTRTTQGTGLGLYLVRQIVRAHGGEVRVHRTGSDGTVFRVGLPGATAVEEAP